MGTGISISTEMCRHSSSPKGVLLFRGGCGLSSILFSRLVLNPARSSALKSGELMTSFVSRVISLSDLRLPPVWNQVISRYFDMLEKGQGGGWGAAMGRYLFSGGKLAKSSGFRCASGS